jgi:hypothetical protein
MIEPRCLIEWDGASSLFQAVVVEKENGFFGTGIVSTDEISARNRERQGNWAIEPTLDAGAWRQAATDCGRN